MADCPRCVGLPDYGIDYSQFPDDGHCKQCGSLNADTFMARLEAGTVKIDPTDKNYKVYVHNDGGEDFQQSYRIDSIEDRTKAAATNARRLRCSHEIVTKSFGADQVTACAKCGFQDGSPLSEGDLDDAKRYEAGEPLDKMKNWKFTTRTTRQTKFYFQHLNEAQMRRFVELLNEKKIKFGEPGHFYRKPYFIE